MSEAAVLNANYVLAQLRTPEVAYDRLCMHEFVLSRRPLKESGVPALDVTNGSSTTASTLRRSTSR